MLYALLYPLKDTFSAFNLFRYITFRAMFAAVTALLISFIVGPLVIRILKKAQIGEVIRDDGPATHGAKAGTPTMGGAIVLLSALLPTLLWARINNAYILLAVFATLWMGVIGFLDDYLKVVKKFKKGLIARYKMLGQIVMGLLFGLALVWGPWRNEPLVTSTTIPFLKTATFDFGILFVPFVVLFMTYFSNAVNLTDGLDGLAIGLCGIAFTAMLGMAYVSGNVKFAHYLSVPYLEGTGELAVFCAGMAGACLGFLWFNANPASIFMGDTGSLPLGAALAAVAVLIKKEILLILVGGVFVAEALSVIIQVGSYKWRKKRVFKMAPVHHHFELLGWKESKIVIRFWIAGILLAILTLSTFKIR